jgi:hypothetical protein
MTPLSQKQENLVRERIFNIDNDDVGNKLPYSDFMLYHLVYTHLLTEKLCPIPDLFFLTDNQIVEASNIIAIMLSSEIKNPEMINRFCLILTLLRSLIGDCDKIMQKVETYERYFQRKKIDLYSVNRQIEETFLDMDSGYPKLKPDGYCQLPHF